MPSPNDLTRQQLDELDTLLQRMLAGPSIPAAPVAPPPPPPAPVRPAPTGWRADVPAAVPAAPAPHLSPVQVEVPEPVAVPRANPFAYAAEPTPAFVPQPTPVTAYRPSEPAAYQVPEDDEPVDYAPIPLTPPILELQAAPEPAAASPASHAAVEAAPSGVPTVLMPLYGCSRAMEFALNLLGPPGQMLTTPAGKNLLAGVGVFLMAGAGVWYARGLGMIQLPFLP